MKIENYLKLAEEIQKFEDKDIQKLYKNRFFQGNEDLNIIIEMEYYRRFNNEIIC